MNDEIRRTLNEVSFASTLLEPDAKCELNHKNDPSGPVQPATDVLVQAFGLENTTEPEHFVIPVCYECAVTLQTSSEYVLLFCLDCHASQWIFKPLARKLYGDTRIVWQTNCPSCDFTKPPKLWAR